MSDYRPPVEDLAFVLEHIAGYPEIAQLPGLEHADFETVVGLLEEAGAFMSEVVAPLNVASDVEGAQHQPDGSVKTPTGFKDAYSKYVDAGWGSVPFTEEYGGGSPCRCCSSRWPRCSRRARSTRFSSTATMSRSRRSCRR